jgi:nitronate monooxygenase
MTLLDALPIPIIQAPMWGASTQAMALAVSRAGGMGQLAAAGLRPEQIEAAVAELKREAGAPFGVNLLMSEPVQPDGAEVEAALRTLKPWYEARGVELPPTPNTYALDFEAQLRAVIAAAPPVASFAFSILTTDQVAALHAREIFVIGTATTVAEARAWEAVGADAVCAQGMEAGGHRGHFLKPLEESLVGTMALVATARQAVKVPVVAAGGIMDGRGVAAALALGAAAAQMGSAFLLAEQSMVSPPWRRAIEGAPDDPTALTRAFSGRYARGIENDFMRVMKDAEVPAYPVQNRLTQPLRTAAAAAGDASVMSLWAGQAVRLATPGAAAELVRRWWAEARAVAGELTERTAPPKPLPK